MTVKFSIITPTYNDEMFLSNCVESVKSQEADHEHIVIDGNSTDNTKAYLASQKHLKFISEDDNGMYDAVNKGLKMAKGDVLSYINSDDCYYDYTLETVKDVFVNHPEVDFVYGNLTFISIKHKKLFGLKAVPFIPGLAKTGRVTWGQPTCFWRSRIHDKIGYFNDKYKNCGDYDFFCRLLTNNFRGYYLNKALVKFMLRPDCISKTFASNMKIEKLEIDKKYSRNCWKPRNILSELIFRMRNIQYLPRKLYYKYYLGLL